MDEDYKENVKKLIKKLSEKQDPSMDRLGHAGLIQECIVGINASTLGWQSWISSPNVLNKLTLEEVQEISKFLNEYTIKLLEFDIRYVEIMEAKNAKKVKENVKPVGYVS